MNNDEFFCAELGMIDLANIESYSPTDFQREFLSILDNGIKNYDGKLKLHLVEFADKFGMIPRLDDGEAIRDESMPFSVDHIEMVIRIRHSRQHGLAQRQTANDPLQKVLRPAFEIVVNLSNPNIDFYRTDLRNRWQVAGDACKWDGVIQIGDRMIAKTDSPIWKCLGNQDLFDDGLGINYPPFYLNGGWLFGWKSITKKELDG